MGIPLEFHYYTLGYQQLSLDLWQQRVLSPIFNDALYGKDIRRHLQYRTLSTHKITYKA